MRFISTKVHGVLDYLMGIILIAAPWLLGFAGSGTAAWVPIILGVGVIAYSVFTDYELGLIRVLSMRGHLGLDIASGILLAASPWLFRFSDVIIWPHLLFGLLEIGAGLFTQLVPGRRTAVSGTA